MGRTVDKALWEKLQKQKKKTKQAKQAKKTSEAPRRTSPRLDGRARKGKVAAREKEKAAKGKRFKNYNRRRDAELKQQAELKKQEEEAERKRKELELKKKQEKAERIQAQLKRVEDEQRAIKQKEREVKRELEELRLMQGEDQLMKQLVQKENEDKIISSWQKFAITAKQKNALRTLRTVKKEKTQFLLRVILDKRKNSNPQKAKEEIAALNKKPYEKDDYKAYDYVVGEQKLDKTDVKQAIKKNIKLKAIQVSNLKDQFDAATKKRDTLREGLDSDDEQKTGVEELKQRHAKANKEVKALAEELIDQFISLRAEVQLLDHALSNKDLLEKLNKNDTDKYTRMFKNNINICSKRYIQDEDDLRRCLLERGMVYASCLWGTEKATKNNETMIEICNLLIGSQKSDVLRKTSFYRLGQMLQRCLTRIQIKMFNKIKLDDDEIRLINLMRDVPILESLYKQNRAPIDPAVYKEIFMLVQKLEENIMVTEKEIEEELEVIVPHMVQQYEKTTKRTQNFNTIIGIIIYLTFLYFYWSSGEMKKAQEGVGNLRRPEPEPSIWDRFGSEKVKKFNQMIEIAYPLATLALQAYASYGLVLILVNRAMTIPFVERLFYAPKQERQQTIARAYEQTLASFYNANVRRAQAGGAMIVQGMSFWLMIMSGYETFKQVKNASENQMLATVVPLAVAAFAGYHTGSTQTASATYSLTNAMANRLMHAQMQFNKIDQVLTYVAMSGMMSALQYVLAETGNIDPLVAAQLRQEFRNNQQGIQRATNEIETLITGLGKQLRNDLTAIVQNASRLRLQERAGGAVKYVKRKPPTCTICGVVGHRAGSKSCDFSATYKKMKVDADRQKISSAEMLRRYRTWTDDQKIAYCREADVQYAARSAQELRGTINQVQEIISETEVRGAVDASSDGIIYTDFMKALLDGTLHEIMGSTMPQMSVDNAFGIKF